MEILNDSNVKWEKPGDTISHGYVTVRTRSKPSFKLREQGHFPSDGIFDIEKDYITVFPSRSDEIPAIPRHNKPDRIAARRLYELTHKS